ncbi:MAG: hypothetical protein ACTSPI_16720 [Candidatus Heimdallarchaeaceae archaeon]
MAGRKRDPKRKWEMKSYSLDKSIVKRFGKICKERGESANLQIENFMKSVIGDYDKSNEEKERVEV